MRPNWIPPASERQGIARGELAQTP
jgi:hypothetical protein